MTPILNNFAFYIYHTRVTMIHESIKK